MTAQFANTLGTFRTLSKLECPEMLDTVGKKCEIGPNDSRHRLRALFQWLCLIPGLNPNQPIVILDARLADVLGAAQQTAEFQDISTLIFGEAIVVKIGSDLLQPDRNTLFYAAVRTVNCLDIAYGGQINTWFTDWRKIVNSESRFPVFSIAQRL